VVLVHHQPGVGSGEQLVLGTLLLLSSAMRQCIVASASGAAAACIDVHGWGSWAFWLWWYQQTRTGCGWGPVAELLLLSWCF
jgi:hypothetical protein